MPLLFWAHRGDSFQCPAIACHCFSILRLHYAKHLPAAPLQHYATLRFSIAFLRYASLRKASAVLLVPKQNSACPMQFLTVRRSTSPLLCFSIRCRSFAMPRRAAQREPQPSPRSVGFSAHLFLREEVRFLHHVPKSLFRSAEVVTFLIEHLVDIPAFTRVSPLAKTAVETVVQPFPQQRFVS